MTEWTQTIKLSRAQDLKSLETLAGQGDRRTEEVDTEEVGDTSALTSYSHRLSCQHRMYRSQKDGIQESAWSLFAA